MGIAADHCGRQLAWGTILKQLAAAAGANAGLATTPPWLAGLIIAAGLLMVLILAVLSRRLGVPNVAAAAGLVYLLIGFVYYLFGDGGNPLTTAWLAWPFLGSVLGLGVLLFIRNPVGKVILMACSAFLMLALMVPQIWMGAYTDRSSLDPDPGDMRLGGSFHCPGGNPAPRQATRSDGFPTESTGLRRR